MYLIERRCLSCLLDPSLEARVTISYFTFPRTLIFFVILLISIINSVTGIIFWKVGSVPIAEVMASYSNKLSVKADVAAYVDCTIVMQAIRETINFFILAP